MDAFCIFGTKKVSLGNNWFIKNSNELGNITEAPGVISFEDMTKKNAIRKEFLSRINLIYY